MKEQITIGFIGDFFWGESTPILDKEIQNHLQKLDFVIANLEGPIFTPSVNNHSFGLYNQSGIERYFSQWNINIVSVANNHIFDFGREGWESTQKKLDEAGIQYFGAGKNIEDATKPYIIEIDKQKIVLLTGTESLKRTNAKLATKNTEGCQSIDLLSEQIKHWKDKQYWVIVFSHWGICGMAYPPNDIVFKIEHFFDNGADVVIGHHSHVLQGERIRDDKKIAAYSLGNFYFAPFNIKNISIPSTGNQLQGAVLVLHITSTTIHHEWLFTRQKNNLILLDNTTLRMKKMKKMSQPFIEIKKYPLFWKRCLLFYMLKSFLNWRKWYPKLLKQRIIATKFFLKQIFFNR
jgi:hypothetical protein